MPALSINVPFPVFQDRDGQPLDNGYVYIGTPYLDPQTNPVQVYFDDALTIPATQPLRTINGYVSNAGTPAQLYVNGVNFSIKVLDSKANLVYSFPDGSGISPNASGVDFTGFKSQVGKVSDLAGNDGADWIGFNPVLSGSSPRSAQDKLREIVSVKDFGAVGDGVSNDTAAIQAAIDYAAGQYAPKPVVVFPAGIYRTTSSIRLYGNTKIQGQASNLYSSVIKLDGTSNTDAVIVWSGSNTVGTYQNAIQDLMIDCRTSTNATGLRLKLVSEFYSDNIHIKGAKNGVHFDNAAIVFFNGLITAECQNALLFNQTLSVSGFSNTFIDIRKTNFYDSSNAVIAIQSGVVSNLTIKDGWAEYFNGFIKAVPGGTYPVGWNILAIKDFWASYGPTSPYTNVKLIEVTANPTSDGQIFIRTIFDNCTLQVSSTTSVCEFDLNGNTNVNTLLGSWINFNNCTISGAGSGYALVNSNTDKTSVRITGITDYRPTSGAGFILNPVRGSAKVIDTNQVVNYIPAWTASTTNPTLGNGAIYGKYIVTSGICKVQIELDMGSTTTGGTGFYYFSLPFINKTGWLKATGSFVIQSTTPIIAGTAMVNAGQDLVYLNVDGKSSIIAASDVTINSSTKIIINLEYTIWADPILN